MSSPLDPKFASKLKNWPYREAQALQKSLRKRTPKSGKILLETGFGPSGLPHIGTFAEVARTTWVRQAYELLTGEQTLLYAFSDDLDGLRKVPDNMPNQAMLLEHLGKPLCDIPDPFGEAESFSGYMNMKLKEFLDKFGFEYEFKASHLQYRGGVFNDGLSRILTEYDKVRNVILPTLSPENRDAWSPFMPVCASCGKVYTTRVTKVMPEQGLVAYACDQDYKGIKSCGHTAETPVTDGAVKVGWKVDWALRWYTFGVNYEMYGKDLIDSAKLSGKICRILGESPPVGMFYELFLDEEGRKISKSLGNGLTIDEWLTYGPLESLGLFIAKKPRQASKLYFGVIPQHVDELLQHYRRFEGLEGVQHYNSPIWFLRHNDVQDPEKEVVYHSDLNFSTLLNLVSALNTSERDVVWDYVRRYDPEIDRDASVLNVLIDRALAYYRDFVLPKKAYALPSDEMRPAVDAFLAFLETYEGHSGEEIQTAAYAAAKERDLNLRAFFKTMYQLLLGEAQGPRLGTFVQLYGVKETLALANEQLERLS